MAGSRDQVIILSDNWESAGGQGGTSNPDRLNLNLRWLANKPWVQLTTMERINAGQVDVNNDGVVNGSDTWYVNDRGTAAFNNTPKDYVRHASGLSYDNWFNGSALEESFTNRFPFVRSGVPGGFRMGRLGSPGTIVHDAWTNSAAVTGSLSNLARLVYLNGVWETAFHNEDSSDLSKFSTGAYKNPDATYDTLAPFAFNNNARVTRAAGLVAAAARWGATVASTNTVATSADLDADGEAEYTLSNDRVFAVFERIGGRLVVAFTRDPLSGKVVQAVGNLHSVPEGEGEEEGITSLSGSSALALRTSGFKDWFAVGFGAGTQYINDLYTVSSVTNGWQLVSADGRIAKTITLPPGADRLEAAYQLSGGLTKLYVRHGLSPDMADLMVSGQANLRGPTNVAGRVEVANANSNAVTRTALALSGAGYTNVAWNSAATDRHSSFTTFNMRNQAQTHQVELESLGTNFTFALQLSVQGGDTDADNDGLGAYEEELLGTNPNLRDSDGDGMEDQWEKLYRNAAVAQDGNVDTDGDGQSDRLESIAGTNPNDSKEYFRITGITRNPGGQVTVTWSTTWSPQITVPRRFIVLYSDDLSTPFAPLGNTGVNPLPPSGPTTSHTDTNAPALRRNYRIQVITP